MPVAAVTEQPRPGLYNKPLELMRAAHLDDYTAFEQKVTADPAL